jgi:hypothetical protein
MINPNDAEALEDAEKKFIVEGCQSYLDVITAVNFFQVRICGVAIKLLNDSRERIAKSFNLKDKINYEADAAVYPEAHKSDYDGSYASIGASLYIGDPQDMKIHLYLYFDRGEKGVDEMFVHTCFALEVSKKWQLEALKEIFKKNVKKEISEDWGWLAVDVCNPLHDASNLREELSAILDESLAWWESNAPAPKTGD